MRHPQATATLRSRASAAALLLMLSVTARAESYFNPAFLSDDAASVADLSRFEQGHHQPAGVYRVDVWRNNEFIATQDVRFIDAPAGSATGPASGGLTACIDAQWLVSLGVNGDALPALKQAEPGTCLPVSQIIPGAQVDVNFAKLRLDISLPQAAMDNRARGDISPDKWDNGISALLMNYQFSGNRGTDGDSYYLNLQSGANWGPWRLRNTGAWSASAGNAGSRSQWRNINTYLQRAIVKLKSALVVGQSTTGGEVFDSIGFSGARLYSSDMMYPDSLQGYAPVVRGIAQSAAKVVIRQNGYVVDQRYVTPGAFAIADLTPTSSNGDLAVTIEESDGRIQRYTVPYATVPLLQREGRLKYDLVAGRFRSGSAGQGDPTFGQATAIAGLGLGYTAFAGTQLAERYRAFSLGVGKNMGRWGAFSMDLTTAQSQLADGSRHQGQSLRFLYAKSLAQTGTNFQLLGYRYSTRGFYTLDDVAWRSMTGRSQPEPQQNALRHTAPVDTQYHNLRYSKKGRIQASLSQPLGHYGSLYFSGSQQSYWGTSETNSTYQFGYASSWHGISYSLSWSQHRSTGLQNRDRILAVNLSVPFSLFSGAGQARDSALSRTWATSSLSQSAQNGSSWQAGVGGTLLKERNLSYNIAKGRSQQGAESDSLSADWQSRYGQLGGTWTRTSRQQEVNWQASGGVIAHSDGVTFSSMLGDTNVLVKAPGAAGVGIENQSNIKTDWRGYAVVPYATVYRHNRIALDNATLDDHTDIEKSVSDVVPTEGAIVRASFNTRVGVRAMITVKRGQRPVPFGAVVREEQSGVTSLVGDGGETFLSGLPLKGTLIIQWGKGKDQRCRAHYALPETSMQQPVTTAIATCASP
ncbi:fimbrial biogenesis usher protein [Pantoea sp. 1.19]|uniref:fimbrial biogenesis usher protein n=1 Tax=Pantoea sp. 1.19 TaxID=1925589 RepID=UPI000948B72E|nr:fimbrial biogenesis usher protein [Pantoea sp. 1.19]